MPGLSKGLVCQVNFPSKKCQVNVSFIFRKYKINSCYISLFNNKISFVLSYAMSKYMCARFVYFLHKRREKTVTLVVLANKNVLVNSATMLLKIKLLLY
jgi:hypothetical protein